MITRLFLPATATYCRLLSSNRLFILEINVNLNYKFHFFFGTNILLEPIFDGLIEAAAAIHVICFCFLSKVSILGRSYFTFKSNYAKFYIKFGIHSRQALRFRKLTHFVIGFQPNLVLFIQNILIKSNLFRFKQIKPLHA